MSRSRNTRSPLDRGEPTLQLTSHQLIIAITALLLWGVVCFVFGILATKLEMRFREKPDAEMAGLEGVDKADEAATTGEQATPGRAEVDGKAVLSGGRQTSPRRDVFDSTTSGRREAAVSSTSSPGAGRSASGLPDVHLPVKVPAPSPQKEQAVTEQPKASAVPAAKPITPLQPIDPMEVEEKPGGAPSTLKTDDPPVDLAKPAGAQPAASANGEAGTKPPEGMKPPDAAGKAAQKAESSVPEIEPLPASKPAAEGASGGAKGGFAVQVASLDGKGAAKAEEYRKRVAKETGLEVRVVPSEDGKHLRILAGTYATREAAQKARDELRKRKEYEGCYVKSLP